MSNNARHGWVLGIPALILVLILVIIWKEPKGDGVSCAVAGRAITLALCSGEELREWQKSAHTSRFSVKEQEQWYVPYLDYLYAHGYLEEDLIPAKERAVVDTITYGEMESLLNGVSDSLGKLARATKKNKNQPFPKEQFADLYERLTETLAVQDKVEKRTLMIYGTPLNLENAAVWTVYTNRGDYRFDGLALDAYIDREVEVFVRDGDLIWLDKLVSDYVVYKNVWVMEGSKDDLLVFLGSIKRELPYDSVFGKEKVYNQVADLTLKAGKLEKISIKKERIYSRVLAVHDTYLEIEGYGNLELADGFRVLKIYGQFEEQSLKDILVGYDLQEFVVAEGKICAALTVREFDADRIRVLLKTTGFHALTHPSIRLSCENSLTMTIGTETQTIPAGEVLELTPESGLIAAGRLLLNSDGEAGIKILSIEREGGMTPVYEGQIEIAKADEGLVLVNDVFLEDYLKKVVPSEMPAYFEKEALKAQAVCARTYAYMQLKGNRYQSYGAHVDDSTAFQVYNNIVTDTRTDAAVQETYGELLTYEGAPVSAYYFSTSCGSTTDGTVWGVDSSELPYLKSVCLQGSRETLNLTDNDVFSSFIKNQDYPSYDSSSSFYRWQTTISSNTLKTKITDIGEIKDIKVAERGAGGFVKTLDIVGSEGTRTIMGQDNVRLTLGDESTPIKKKSGDDSKNWGTLPSAFLTVEKGTADENGNVTFHIYGGGYGHGAGMSQYGAQGMAKQGKTYREILEFFYERVAVETLEAASDAAPGGEST